MPKLKLKVIETFHPTRSTTFQFELHGVLNDLISQEKHTLEVISQGRDLEDPDSRFTRGKGLVKLDGQRFPANLLGMVEFLTF